MTVFALTTLIYVAGLALPIFAQQAIDQISRRDITASLVWFALGAGVAILAEALLTRIRQGLIITIGSFLDRRISRAVFLHLVRRRADLGEFKPGVTLNRFQQAGKIRNFVLQLVPQVLFDAGNAIIAIALMFYYDIVIGAVTLAATLVCAAVLRKQLGRFYVAAEAHYRNEGLRQNALSETIAGFSTVKALGLESFHLRRWIGMTDMVLQALTDLSKQARQFMVGAQLVTRALTFLVLVVGCLRILYGHLSIGELLALQLLAARTVAPIVGCSDVFRQFQEVSVAIDGLRHFMNEPRERAAVVPPLRSIGDGGIEATNVTLRYSPGSTAAIENLTFKLPPQGVVAVVGRNGSGKSTLVRTLIGLQRNYEGTILLGGRDLRDYNPRYIRSRMGIVDQDTILFAGTIRDNIMGTAASDDEAVWEALNQAGALTFVEALPGGLQTTVETRGQNFSDGQRQRLSIARAVIRNPRIALLDEPTAFLDAEAAVSLERNLALWGRDRLLILVSHHLAATRSADLILVLHEGRLAGAGRHEELLHGCPEYATLWSDYLRSIDGVGHATAAE